YQKASEVKTDVESLTRGAAVAPPAKAEKRDAPATVLFVTVAALATPLLAALWVMLAHSPWPLACLAALPWLFLLGVESEKARNRVIEFGIAVVLAAVTLAVWREGDAWPLLALPASLAGLLGFALLASSIDSESSKTEPALK